MYTTYQQNRIPKGCKGYQIATDAVAQRGISLDITRIGVARMLDMQMELTHVEDLRNMADHEKELGALIDKMMEWTPEERKHETSAALAELTGRYLPSDLDRRRRFNVFDAIHRADLAYGRENVDAFLEEYHADKRFILDVVSA